MTRLIPLVLALCLVSCGEDDPAPVAETPAPAQTATEEPTAAGDAVVVTIKDFEYSPDPAEVKVGETVRFVNEDAALHTATAEGRFDSKNIAQNGTFEWTPQAGDVGSVEYVCTIHPSMQATVEVAE